uniref:hypothetical protein n=1 Tax=Litorivivens sp. TaxID=2020868 RepID=UPI003563CD19
LTQDHWDTARAIELMELEAPPSAPFETLYNAAGASVERIVDFADFEVHRCTLVPGAALLLDSPEDYAVLMVVKGELLLGECPLLPEQAVFVPSSWASREISNESMQELVFLVAYPR